MFAPSSSSFLWSVFIQGLYKCQQEGVPSKERGGHGQRQPWRRWWGGKWRWLGRGRRWSIFLCFRNCPILFFCLILFGVMSLIAVLSFSFETCKTKEKVAVGTDFWYKEKFNTRLLGQVVYSLPLLAVNRVDYEIKRQYHSRKNRSLKKKKKYRFLKS